MNFGENLFGECPRMQNGGPSFNVWRIDDLAYLEFVHMVGGAFLTFVNLCFVLG